MKQNDQHYKIMFFVRTLLFLSLLLFYFNGSAQVHIGFTMGFNLSKTSVLFDSDMNSYILSRRGISRPSFYIPVQYPLNDWLSLSTGLRYSEEGNTLQIENGNTFVSNKIAYLSVPILAKARLQLNKYALYGTIGPYIGRAISAHSIDYRLENPIKIKLQSQRKSSYDYGVIGGIGIERKLTKDLKIICQLNSQIGFHDINLEEDSESFTESSGLLLGLLIPISHKQ